MCYLGSVLLLTSTAHMYNVMYYLCSVLLLTVLSSSRENASNWT